MKDTLIQPYLFFDGCCEEAVKFYGQHLEAEVQMMMRYNESPDPIPEGMVPPGYEEKIMHVSFSIGGNTIMASDGGGCGEAAPPKFDGFSLSLSLDDETEARRIFDLLAEAGKVEMPIGKTFWSPCFGSVTDPFGLSWMINVNPSETSES